MIDKEAKLNAVAEILQGKVVEKEGVEICVKGTIMGFPATLESFRAGFPFGVTFIVETEVLEPGEKIEDEGLRVTVMPRYARGFMGFVTRIFLLESKGQSTGEKSFDSRYITSFNDRGEAERLIKYPGVIEKIEKLSSYSKFSELGIRTRAGLYVSQQKSFNQINLDVVRETFHLLGELGQVIFEAF